MSILDQIVADKRKEVEERKALFPVKLLEQSPYFEGKVVSMSQYLRRPDKVGIIAEFKRQSPSKGIINNKVSVEKVSIGYMQAGVAGLSILTDKKYFGGKSEDLTTARSFNFCPILRKDFIVDEYQLIEAKSIGADIILLIAACLTPGEIKNLASMAQDLGMEVLLEVHNKEELERSLTEKVNIVGVNNRDLNTFVTDVKTSKELAELIPDNFLKISESGISEPQTVVDLMGHGFEGFLIGENFMKTTSPERACRNFVKGIKELIK
ncbi:MAG: indole-3-glycerol phosphate synthase TrpC [Cyclobacteriaceae bacterium]|nr:indole-3-glycerol phosphate synthase TrpC [Cyclobacteriaceae bacterium SS2]